MLETNSKDSKQYRYFDIQSYPDKNGRLKWIAWFFRDVTETLKEEARNGDA